MCAPWEGGYFLSNIWTSGLYILYVFSPLVSKSFHESCILYQQCQCLILPEKILKRFCLPGVWGNLKICQFFPSHILVITFLQSLFTPLTYIPDNLYFLKFLNMSFNLQKYSCKSGRARVTFISQK